MNKDLFSLPKHSPGPFVARGSSLCVRPSLSEVPDSRGPCEYFGRLKRNKLKICGIIAMLGAGASLFAAQVTPVYDVRFFSGQNFSNGKESSLSGNMDVTISPAVKFNEKWSVIPTYAGGYQGTRDVQDLAGGGTLFQDSTYQNIFAKGIFAATPSWKIKATAGSRWEFLRETKDETWGKGLFDYRKYSGGLETQYDFSPEMGARLAGDYFQLVFPNYKSLESSQDATLSRELSGAKVLNSDNIMGTVGGWFPLPASLRAGLDYYYIERSFNDQPKVLSTGDLSATDRFDIVKAITISLGRPWSWGESLRASTELGFTYNKANSNQNHFDARLGAFNPNYYDYRQTTFNPRVSLAWGDKPWTFSLGGSLTQRGYKNRLTQDANGNPLTSKLKITEKSVNLGTAYPLAANFKVRAQANEAWSHSNTKYDKVFQYDYKITNYLLGFSYEY